MFKAIETLLKTINDQFVDGFWSSFLVAAVVTALAIVLIRLIGRGLTKLSESGRFGTFNAAYARRIMAAIIILLAGMLILSQVKPFQSVTKSVLASSGVLAVILGFAAQQAMANVVGGFFISVFKPFSISDRVKLVDQGIEGIVEDISLRHTVVRTFENTRVIVPNSVMNSSILENAHYQEAKVCRFLEIGVSYKSDLDRAMAIIAQEVRVHRNYYDNRTVEEIASGTPEVVVRVAELADWAVKLRTAVWAADAGTAYAMLCDLRYSIKKRFDAEGIEIPVLCRTMLLQPGHTGESANSTGNADNIK